MVQWLGLHAVTAQGPGLIPGLGFKFLQYKKKKKKTRSYSLCGTAKKKRYISNWQMIMPIVDEVNSKMDSHTWQSKNQ